MKNYNYTNTFKTCEQTYVCQLNKNKSTLEIFAASKDKSGAKLQSYYTFLVNIIRGTKAWNMPGTNDMLNDLATACRNTINHTRQGKTSAGAHARKMLRLIEWYGDQYAQPCKHYTYRPFYELTDEELDELANC